MVRQNSGDIVYRPGNVGRLLDAITGTVDFDATNFLGVHYQVGPLGSLYDAVPGMRESKWNVVIDFDNGGVVSSNLDHGDGLY